jgi:predicted DNA-binding transcriptional regulator AlpA
MSVSFRRAESSPWIILWSIESSEPVASKPQNINSGAEVSELLTAKDLEELLKTDRKTIYRYVACGLIPHVRIQSNIRFIKWQIAKLNLRRRA